MDKKKKEAMRREKETTFLREQLRFEQARNRFVPYIFLEVPNPEDGITDELGFPRYMKESELSPAAQEKLAEVTDFDRQVVLGSSELGALRFPDQHEGLRPKHFTARGKAAFRNYYAGYFQLFYGNYQDELLSCKNVGFLRVWSAVRTGGTGTSEWREYYQDAYYAVIIGSSASIRVGSTQLPQAPGYHIRYKEGKTLISPVQRPLLPPVLSITTERWKTFRDISEF